MAYLLGLDGLNEKIEIPEDGVAYRLGRAEDCSLVIDDDSISGHHCEIWINAGTCGVRDLGSTNGIRINEEDFLECQLQDGDILEVGDIRFQLDGAHLTPRPETIASEVKEEPPTPAVFRDEAELPGEVVTPAAAPPPVDLAEPSPLYTGLGLAALLLFGIALLAYLWLIVN